MPMTEDASAFFNINEFSSRAWFNGADTTDNDAAILVNLDQEYVDFDQQVASTNPMCECLLTDVTDVEFAEGKDLVIGTIVYKITNARPDLNAFTVVLELEQQGYL